MIGALLLAATVTLDVKDAKARDVLKSLQKQCAVKNLIVDPDVPEGSASFYFHDVPCRTAFDVVLSTYKLKAVEYSTSTVAVERNNG
ncbi:MAG TPA: hypothetical protein VKU62_01395 [Thermoanaerobaculia bacterium]|nr:hypothetical protein [Thermoanaerobaculia bacterium]